MKAIRISDEAYEFLNKLAKSEKRSLIATLDLFIEIFKEANCENGLLEKKGISQIGKEGVKFKSEYWFKIRRKVFKRDKYQCIRCEKFFLENGLQLMVHHIIPRKEGGTSNMKNLITLCNKCHDYAEVNGFDFSFITTEVTIVAKSLDWHKWVYGGYTKLF